LFGEAHQATWVTRAQRVTLLRQTHEWAEVVQEAEQLLPLLRQALGGEHTLTLHLLADLARARRGLRQLPAARQLQGEVVAAWRRSAGPEDKGTLEAVAELAATLPESGRAAEADKLCAQALPVCRRVLGPEHVTTLVLRNAHAKSLMALGRLAE